MDSPRQRILDSIVRRGEQLAPESTNLCSYCFVPPIGREDHWMAKSLQSRAQDEASSTNVAVTVAEEALCRGMENATVDPADCELCTNPFAQCGHVNMNSTDETSSICPVAESRPSGPMTRDQIDQLRRKISE